MRTSAILISLVATLIHCAYLGGRSRLGTSVAYIAMVDPSQSK